MPAGAYGPRLCEFVGLEATPTLNVALVQGGAFDCTTALFDSVELNDVCDWVRP
jgi:hypothetical protein